MSLRLATLSIVVSVLIVFSTISYITSRQVIVDGFQSIEDDNAKDDALRGLNALNQILDRLDSLLVDWAYWDDTYAFIQNRNKPYIKSNLTVETLSKQHLAFVAFTSLEGKVVWGQSVDKSGKTFQPLPAELGRLLGAGAPLGPNGSLPVAVKGVVMLGGAPYMVAARSILDSDALKTPRGVCVMARAIDHTLAEDLSRTVMLTMNLAPLSLEDAATARLGGGETDVTLTKTQSSIIAFTIIPDIFGAPALKLSIHDDRSAFSVGIYTFRVHFVLLLATGTCVALAFLALLEGRIIRRIGLIARQTRCIREPGGASSVIEIKGGDELASLARDINQMTARTEANERFLQQIMDAIQAGVVLVCSESRTVADANAFALKLLGRERQAVLGRSYQDFLCLAGPDRIDPELGPTPEKPFTGHVIAADGTTIAVLASVSSVVRDGRRLMLMTFIDISELEQTQQALRASEDRYRTVFMNTGTACVLVSENTNVVLANNEFVKLSGYSQERITSGVPFTTFFAAEEWERLLEYHNKRRVDSGLAPREYEAVFMDLYGLRRDVMMTVALIPGTSLSVASILDITDMKSAQRQLEHQAFHDSLTGLPNRILLQDRLSHAMSAAQREGRIVGVLLLDLDRFKQVNDSFGHPFGDEVLGQAAARLAAMLRKHDTVARLGGDEFVVVIERPNSLEDLAKVAKSILSLFEKPFVVRGHSIYLGASIGVAVFPFDAKEPDDLIKNADLAMYRSKEEGKNTFTFFTKDLDRKALSKMLLETELYTAFNEGGFHVVYQPKVDASMNRVVGCEALVRWRKPDGLVVSPADFIPLAEETGLIVRLDELVLRTACKQVAAWHALGVPGLTVAVNLSARNFQEQNLVANVKAVLDETGLAAELLEIELTETALMRNWESAVSAIDELSRLGIRILLDDFGTGYSSLYYLRKLPITAIKIDKSFVGEVDLPHSESKTLVKTIISLASNLGIGTVAEGVETREQLAFLLEHGCPIIQGFLFSRPVDAEAFEALLGKPLAPSPSEALDEEPGRQA